MNLAIRGFAADLGQEPADTFARDQFPDQKFDYILANPPFNISDWGGEKYESDPRWVYGRPPVGNANYAWLQHMLWKLRPGGEAGVVLANGSMSSNQSGEGQIRRADSKYVAGARAGLLLSGSMAAVIPSFSVPEAVAAATDPDLISFLKAIPDTRMRRGIRIPAWYLLLVAVLGILSKCESLRDLERFARRHHAVLTETLGIELKRPPSDSAFRYFFLQVDVASICAAIREWTLAQIPGGATDLDQLICDGKTLRGSIEATAGGGSAFIAQVTLYSAALGLAIAQGCYATNRGNEHAELKKLLGELELEGVLIQADALHTHKAFFGSSRSRGPTSC